MISRFKMDLSQKIFGALLFLMIGISLDFAVFAQTQSTISPFGVGTTDELQGDDYITEILGTSVGTETVTVYLTTDDGSATITIATHGAKSWLWILIVVLALLIVAVFFLLLSSYLHNLGSEKDEYDVDKAQENTHANPAYDSGEIAHSDPDNELQEVRMGSQVFINEESKIPI